MQQQQQAFALHGLKRFVGLAQIGHAGIAIGGGASRVELGRDHASIFGALDLVGGQVVCQVKRHQRLKCHACRHSALNALAIGHGLRCGGHRRAQVGHDDGTAKLRGHVGHHGLQGVAVAHMQVPVIGPGDGDLGRRSCGS